MTVKLSIITNCRNEAARIRLMAEWIPGHAWPDSGWSVVDEGAQDKQGCVLFF
jgi:hypothetical protein